MLPFFGAFGVSPDATAPFPSDPCVSLRLKTMNSLLKFMQYVLLQRTVVFCVLLCMPNLSCRPIKKIMHYDVIGHYQVEIMQVTHIEGHNVLY